MNKSAKLLKEFRKVMSHNEKGVTIKYSYTQISDWMARVDAHFAKPKKRN